MAFDFTNGKDHPHDPIRDFGAAASAEGIEDEMTTPEKDDVKADPADDVAVDQTDAGVEEATEDELFDTLHVTGTAEGEDEEVSAERAEKLRSLSQDDRLDGSKGASIAKAAGGSSLEAHGNDYDETWWGRFQSRRLGITDYGDYMAITGKGQKNPHTGEREITDKQLERMVAKAVLQKGWTNEIYVMNKGRIDVGLTSRAEKIFHDKMACPGGICEGCAPSFRKSLPEATPFTKGMISGLRHKMDLRRERKEGERAHRKNLKEAERCGRTFTRACMDEDGRREDAVKAAKNERAAREAAQAAEQNAYEESLDGTGAPEHDDHAGHDHSPDDAAHDSAAAAADAGSTKEKYAGPNIGPHV